jgi:PKD repeat protein
VTASDGAWSDRVRILWNASAGATNYHVYRNTTNNSNTATDLGSVTSAGADDFSAVAGTTYWYWVKAFNALGGSPFSSPDTGYRATGVVPTPTPTPVGPTPSPTPSGPPAPTGVSASDGTYSDRVRVSWNPSAGATGYWIYRNTTASPPATEIGGSFSTTYDDSTAVAGQVYYYWVRAGNVSGWGPYSASNTGYRATGVVPTPTPTPPAGLNAAFTFQPTAPTAGKQVQFTDASTGATSWQWTFGDGRTSTARNPLHTYSVRGTYTVTLRITGVSGSAQTSKQITVGAQVRRHLPRR